MFTFLYWLTIGTCPLPPWLLCTVFRLSCSLPKRPHFGEVSVLDLLPGGIARFHCHMGYHLQGETQLTCLNASLPQWSGKVPTCRGDCWHTKANCPINNDSILMIREELETGFVFVFLQNLTKSFSLNKLQLCLYMNTSLAAHSTVHCSSLWGNSEECNSREGAVPFPTPWA